MPKEKQELIQDEMSERIVDAAESIVTGYGVHNLNVRRILQTLGITNRVFYNRFHNVEEVLEKVYKNVIMKIRKVIVTEYDENEDFFEHVLNVVERSLVLSYDTKMQFNQYVFENDSQSQNNYTWWHTEIKKLIDYAKEHKYIRDVDSDIMSYAIWCFCRGYNADAVGRRLPMDIAVKNFRYSFGILLDGMRA